MQDCIFPEVPRVHHLAGASGVTGTASFQTDFLDNMRLSTSAGSQQGAYKLTLQPLKFGVFGFTDGFMSLRELAYHDSLETFLDKATRISCPQEAYGHRHRRLSLLFTADGDVDPIWNSITAPFGAWGHGFLKFPRGSWRGTMLLRWFSNLVLLVGTYSRYALHPSLAAQQSTNFQGDVCIQSRHTVTPRLSESQDVTAILSRPGDSCETACTSEGLRCDVSYLALANSCVEMEETTSCSSCFVRQGPPQQWHPSVLDFPEAVHSSQGGNSTVVSKCVLAATPRHLSCEARAPIMFRRLCTCTFNQGT